MQLGMRAMSCRGDSVWWSRVFATVVALIAGAAASSPALAQFADASLSSGPLATESPDSDLEIVPPTEWTMHQVASDGDLTARFVLTGPAGAPDAEMTVSVYPNPAELTPRSWWSNQAWPASLGCPLNATGGPRGDLGCVDTVTGEEVTLLAVPGHMLAIARRPTVDPAVVEQFLASLPPLDTRSAGPCGPDMTCSGLDIEATIGPTRPGPSRIGEDASEQPYRGPLRVVDPQGVIVARFQTDEAGRYRLPLPPGVYSVESDATGVLPRAEPQTVQVSDHDFTSVHIRFDSGIR